MSEFSSRSKQPSRPARHPQSVPQRTTGAGRAPAAGPLQAVGPAFGLGAAVQRQPEEEEPLQKQDVQRAMLPGEEQEKPV